MTTTIGFTSAGLLARFNLYAGRPPAADAILDATKYMHLADAEQYLINRLSPIVAKVMYQAPSLLTTADGGYTYTFGTDGNGNPTFPMGRTMIFPTSLNCLPGFALRPGYDYLDEGVRIRCVNNTPITGPLYWYGLQNATLMSDTNPPVLQPAQANILTVYKAVSDFAGSANVRNAELSDRMLVQFEREFGYLCTALRKHFRGSPNRNLLTPWAAAYGPSLSTSYAG